MALMICAGCRKEMRPEKNGMNVVFMDHHFYRADLYKCSGCGALVARTAHEALPFECGPISGYATEWDVDMRSEGDE